MEFSGTVQSRSSAQPSRGPPGDAAILALNPARRDRILSATGWKDLCPGTLNLRVTPDIVHRLLLCVAVIRESAEHIVYPPESAHIPKLRIGYLYFQGRLKKQNSVISVLVRRACNPLADVVELLSECKLRDRLKLSDGDAIGCEVDE